MYEEKDWIALECCPICGKERGIAINQKMTKTLPKHVSSDPHLCDDCLKDAKEFGWFIIYEANPQPHKKEPKFTGRFIKARYDALNQNIDEKIRKFIDENRFILMCSEDFEQMEKDNDHTNASKDTSMAS